MEGRLKKNLEGLIISETALYPQPQSSGVYLNLGGFHPLLLMDVSMGYFKTVGRFTDGNAKLRRYELIYLVRLRLKKSSALASRRPHLRSSTTSTLIIQNEDWQA